MIKSIIFLMAVLVLAGCSSYETRHVLMSSCTDQIGDLARCKVMKK